uniref:Uncharacterized protein n=1 Tax=Rhizophora mucronata TaxID=61149 RepID=A0A2P2P9N1_RHIMU
MVVQPAESPTLYTAAWITRNDVIATARATAVSTNVMAAEL